MSASQSPPRSILDVVDQIEEMRQRLDSIDRLGAALDQLAGSVAKIAAAVARLQRDATRIREGEC